MNPVRAPSIEEFYPRIKRPRFEIVLVGDAPPSLGSMDERTALLMGRTRRCDSLAACQQVVYFIVGVGCLAGLVAWGFLAGKGGELAR